MHLNPWATHLPTLQKAVALARPALVVELGPGENSTPFLVQNADRVVSLEMNSQEWADKAAAHGAEAHFDTRPFAWMRFVAMVPDLLFVDQGLEFRNMAHRGLAVQMALDLGVRQVVAHDTEEMRDNYYGYGQIIVPEGYLVEIDASSAPWTTRWWKP